MWSGIADRIKETLRGRVGGNGSNQHQSNSGNISLIATDTGQTRDIAAAAVGPRGRVGGDRGANQHQRWQSGNISGLPADTGDTPRGRAREV